MTTSLLDPSSTIHDLSGHVGVFDRVMEFSANYLVVAAALILLILWWRYRDGLRASAAAAVGAILAVGCSGVIGDLWHRQRPFVAGHFTPLISHAADASFPSDHVAALAAVAAVAWHLSHRLGLCSWVLTAIVGFARVYVGVHWVSDILGGVVLGFTCGNIVWWLTGRSFFETPLQLLDTLLIRCHLRPTTERFAQ